MVEQSIHRAIGELTAEVRGLRRDTQEDRKISSAYRQAVRDDIQKIVLRLTHVESETSSLSHRVEVMQQVTDDVVQLRAKAAGAGVLGHWLIKVGIGVVTLGGWIYAAYAWIAGRPPP